MQFRVVTQVSTAAGPTTSTGDRGEAELRTLIQFILAYLKPGTSVRSSS